MVSPKRRHRDKDTFLGRSSPREDLGKECSRRCPWGSWHEVEAFIRWLCALWSWNTFKLLGPYGTQAYLSVGRVHNAERCAKQGDLPKNDPQSAAFAGTHDSGSGAGHLALPTEESARDAHGHLCIQCPEWRRSPAPPLTWQTWWELLSVGLC